MKLWAEYCSIENKADASFTAALVKMSEAIGCIQEGIHCNKEAHKIWIDIEAWLSRYYARFGSYCGCEQLREEFCAFIAPMLCLERESLETAQIACDKLAESRELDKKLQCIKANMVEHCFPKC